MTGPGGEVSPTGVRRRRKTVPAEGAAGGVAESPELLERARGGDVEALGALCEACKDSLCTYLANAGLAEPDEVEDVYMDAFLRARRSIASFSGVSSFSTWFTSIARNLAFDRRRDRLAHGAVSLDDSPTSETAASGRFSGDPAFGNPSAAPVPGEDLDRRELNALVRSALLELPGKTREALVLFHLGDKSYAEISELLDIPKGTVMSRIHNGRKALARRLGPLLGGAGFAEESG